MHDSAAYNLYAVISQSLLYMSGSSLIQNVMCNTFSYVGLNPVTQLRSKQFYQAYAHTKE